MNKKLMKSLAALVVLAGAVSLTSCDKKAAATAEGDAAGEAATPAFAIPEGAKHVTAADLKTLTDEVIVFDKKTLYLGDDALKNNATVREIYITEGFEFISPGSLCNCTNLEKLVVAPGASCKVYNDNAVQNCTKLKSVTGDVLTVGLETFKGCSALEEATFGNGLYWVRDGAFKGCTNLRKLLLSATLSKMEGEAFDTCDKLEEVGIPTSYMKQLLGKFAGSQNMKKLFLLGMEVKPFPAEAQSLPCENIDVYVADCMVEQFKADASYARFKSIKPMSESGYYNADCFFN